MFQLCKLKDQKQIVIPYYQPTKGNKLSSLKTNPNQRRCLFVPPKKIQAKQKHHQKEVTSHDRKVKSFCWGSDVSCDQKGFRYKKGAVITPANPI